MNRRELYKYLVRAMGTVVAAVVAVPGVRYLIDPLHRRGSPSNQYQRVARLDELASGAPKQVVVTGTREDAWTVYRAEVLGRIWLVRRTSETTPPEATRLEAFTAVCPHEGCMIQLSAGADRFICPCHRAGFHFSGKRLTAAELGKDNPSPRDLDTLACRAVLDQQTGEWWVEVLYQKFQEGMETKETLTV